VKYGEDGGVLCAGCPKMGRQRRLGQRKFHDRRGATGSTRLADGLRASRWIAFYAAMKVRRRLMGSSLYVFHYDDAAKFFVRDLQPKANSYPSVMRTLRV
jgi:hypothetical protein